MDDIIRDSNGNKITTGDKVKFMSRIYMMTKEGVITKMNIKKAVVSMRGCSYNVPLGMLEAR